MRLADCVNTHCPWSGDPVSEDSLTTYRGRVVGFCNTGCRDKFDRATAMFDAAMGSSPRLSHGFVFAKSVDRMQRFYEGAFSMTAETTSDAGFVHMRAGDGAGVALHALPAQIADQIQIADPPRWRDDTAYKLCFETDDLDALRASVVAHGGQAKEPWSWEGTRLCECADPEGNVVQIFAAGQGDD